MAEENVRGLIYLVQAGLEPWEGYHNLPTADHCITVTVVALELRGLDSLISLLGELLLAVTVNFPTLIRWSTATRPFEGGRLRFQRFYSVFSADFPGFSGTFVDLSSHDAIPCRASFLDLSLSRAHLDALAVYHTTFLVMSPDVYLNPRDVCIKLRISAKGLDAGSLADICSREKDWIIARYIYQSCAPFAWQFYGSRSNVGQIAQKLQDYPLKRLQNLDQIAELYDHPSRSVTTPSHDTGTSRYPSRAGK